VFPHGLNAREFELLVGAGVPPIEAIVSATRNAAELLGESATLGSVSSGKFADIVAVEGDPLEDITRMKSMAFVMKNGVVYKGP
jgi:imidazolonepropionase-like amidohydrolase